MIAQGFKWTTLSTIVVVSAQLLQMVLLARFSSAEEFGAVAIIMLVYGLGIMVIEVGLAGSLISAKESELSGSYLFTAIIYSLILGASCFLFVYVFSFEIVEFLNVSFAANAMEIISYSFVVYSLVNVPYIIYRKSLKFKVISKVDLFASLFSLSFFCFYVFKQDVDYLNILAISILLQCIFKVAMCFVFFLSHSKFISFTLDFSCLINFSKFSVYQVSEGIANYFNNQADVVFIAKFLGPDKLGYYYLAKQITMKPFSVINPIVIRMMLPIFAKNKENLVRLTSAYSSTVSLLAIVSVLIYGILFVYSKEVLGILAGDSMTSASAVLSILCVYAMFRTFTNPVGPMMLSLGKLRQTMLWNIFLLFFIPMSIYLSSSLGLEGVALVLSFAMIVFQYPIWYFMIKNNLSIGFVQYLQLFSKSISIFVVLFAPLYFISNDYVKAFLLCLSVSIYIFMSLKNFNKCKRVLLNAE